MDVEEAIRSVFLVQPVPQDFFRTAHGLDQDLPSELSSRFQGRPWPSVSLIDWRMVGAPPASWREYMWPATFAYYVPSILVGTLAEPTFVDLALEAILPFNRQYQPRGEWWFTFANAFSNPQREAMRGFLTSLRETRPKGFDSLDDELIRVAEVVWA